jgi:hypothetical protein
VFALTVLTVLFIIPHVMATRSASAYAHEQELTRLLGVPLNTSHIPVALPPAEQNAAPVYVALGFYLKAHPLTKQEQEAINYRKYSPVTKSHCDLSRAVLLAHPEIARLVHLAASRPKCVFVRNWNQKDPSALLFPEFATIRFAARWLTAESILMAYDGKPTQAVQNEELGFNLANHGGSDNTLISYLVDLAIHAITLGGMERILSIGGRDPKVCEAVIESIETHNSHSSLSCAFKNEAAFRMAMLRMLKDGGPQSLSSFTGSKINLPLTHDMWVSAVDDNGTYMLPYMRKLISTADLPFVQAIPTMQAIDRNGPPKGIKYVIADIFMVKDAGTGAVDRSAEAQASASVVMIGAQVLQWKTLHGKYPDRLDEIMTDIPLDPFTGKPIQYHPEPKGFVVYSVGRDRDFDGGSPTVKPKKWSPTFRYPEPVYAPTSSSAGSH